MKYRLGVLDRILLLNILPKKANIIKLKVISNMQKDIGFSEQEIKDFELKTLDNGNIAWNKDKERKKDIELGDVARSIIRKELEALNEKEELSIEFVNLWDLFVEEER